MSQPIYLEIDSSELNDRIMLLRMAMTPEKFHDAMAGIFRRTGTHVKKILRQDLPQEYNIKPAEVGKAVQGAQTVTSGLGVGCTIPVVGARRHIGGGGRGFTAYGYKKGWNAVKNPKHYDVTAVIYKGQRSKLPDYMSSYGGKPPFRNIPSKLNGLTFTRSGDPRLPIEAVMGIAIPQMPTNKAEPSVQDDIMDFMKRQTEHRIQALIANGR